jgi:hypothetical protein
MWHLDLKKNKDKIVNRGRELFWGTETSRRLEGERQINMIKILHTHV